MPVAAPAVPPVPINARPAVASDTATSAADRPKLRSPFRPIALPCYTAAPVTTDTPFRHSSVSQDDPNVTELPHSVQVKGSEILQAPTDPRFDSVSAAPSHKIRACKGPLGTDHQTLDPAECGLRAR